MIKSSENMVDSNLSARKSRLGFETKTESLLKFETNDHFVSENREQSGDVRESKESGQGRVKTRDLNASIDDKVKDVVVPLRSSGRSSRVTNGVFGKIDLKRDESFFKKKEYDFSDERRNISIPKTPKMISKTTIDINQSDKVKREIVEPKTDEKILMKFKRMSTMRTKARRRVSLNLMGSEMFKNKFKNRKTFYNSIKKESINYNKPRVDSNFQMGKIREEKKVYRRSQMREINLEKFQKEKQALEKMVDDLTLQITDLLKRNKLN